MEWKDILGFSVVAALITALLNQGSTWLLALRQKKQSADFDAVRLAVALERFSYECASRIADERTWRESRGAGGHAFYELPVLAIPETIAWPFLKLDLVDRILVLENDLIRAASILSQERENAFTPDEILHEPSEQAGLLGYRAHILAQDFRAEHQPKRKNEPLYVWDHVATLKAKHDVKSQEYRQLHEAFNGSD